MEVRRLCARKEEIYAKLLGNHKPPVVPGVPMFLETLVKHNVRLWPVSRALIYFAVPLQLKYHPMRSVVIRCPTLHNLIG